VSLLTPSEQERLLIAQGVPADKAHATAFGMTIRVDPGFPRNAVGFEQDGRLVAVITNLSPWPLSLTIPWSCLISDNVKLRAAIRGTMEHPRPTVVLTPEYRKARDRIGALARDRMGSAQPAAIPLKLEARVYVPDNRVHDVVNFSKAVHDAMKGSVFVDDQWLYDSRWIRAGVDVDAPRAEISIIPLTET
jgi:Holliday junction resolvase RusA-like endonuclease